VTELRSKTDAESLWTYALQLIRAEVSDMVFENWFGGTEAIGIEDDKLLVAVRDSFQERALEDRYKTLCEAALHRSYGGSNLKLKVVPAQQAKPKAESARESKAQSPMLNPRYTFDSFVVGSSNRFAHAAAYAVAQTPGSAYNPLFLYSGVGLGKTHLMHAVGHALLARDPQARVLYITSENFVNELITAIQTNRTTEFRNRFRSVDLLMVDDIQFIAGKESMQEEFFHTFNALYESGKQIILSSDKQPKEIPTLEERLRSRFEWGLIADIAKPDIETRIAILRRKAEQEKVSVPEEVNLFIASKIESNIRELEGSLNRVLAKSRLGGQPLSLELAQEALSEMLSIKDPRRITIDLITAVVADYYNVSVDAIKSKKRSREVSVPRQTAMYLCRELNGASLPRIGQEFGGRDHTTVMHAVEKLEKDIAEDEEVRLTIEDLKKRIVGA